VKAKEDITCYTFGQSYQVSWANKTIEPSETNLPLYYILKGSNWNLDVKLNGLIKLDSKDRLQTYCRSFGIDINKIVLATEKEAKKLKARGVEDFATWFNSKHDVTWIDMEEIKKIKSYHNRNLNLGSNKDFAKLSDTNPVKQFIVELARLHKKYEKVQNILNFLEGYDHSSSYHLPVKANDIIVGKILGAYGSDLTEYLILAKAMEK